LNRLNILNRFKTEFKPCPGTVLAGPACRRPTTVLPHFSLFLPHHAAGHQAPLLPSPTCQSRSAASPTPRRSPLFTQQRRRPHLMAEGHCWPCPSPRALLSRSPPPPFPSLLSLCARRFGEDTGTSLRSVSMPELELPSFSTTYAPTSPAPATGDPSSSTVPVRAPPPSPLHGETLPSATILPI
jgi:hypothetical protein